MPKIVTMIAAVSASILLIGCETANQGGYAQRGPVEGRAVERQANDYSGYVGMRENPSPDRAPTPNYQRAYAQDTQPNSRGYDYGYSSPEARRDMYQQQFDASGRRIEQNGFNQAAPNAIPYNTQPTNSYSRNYNETPEYIIGPLDGLQINVYGLPELSRALTVRPDGRISMPLIKSMMAANLTPVQLAERIEFEISDTVKNPNVTVTVTQFSSTFEQQVRVLGEAARPAGIPYQAGMTVSDVMIMVGGLTEYAAGNRATLTRMENGVEKQYRLRLRDLVRRGDVTANIPLLPGDTIIIPESFW